MLSKLTIRIEQMCRLQIGRPRGQARAQRSRLLQRALLLFFVLVFVQIVLIFVIAWFLDRLGRVSRVEFHNTLPLEEVAPREAGLGGNCLETTA